MAIEIKEEWYPMALQLGPPLPRSMQVYWPWVKRPPEEEVPAPPAPPTPPGVPPAVKYRLYIYTVGSGTVTPTDGEYPSGSVITLTAKPGYGAAFDRWAGDAAGISPMFNITMDRNKTATAYFKAITPPPYDEEPPPEEIPPEPEPEPPPEPEPEPEPEPAMPATFSNVSADSVPWSFPSSWKTMNFFCTITNPDDIAGRQTLRLMIIYYSNGSAHAPSEWWRFNLTLNPYQSYAFSFLGNTRGQRHPTAYNGPEMGPGDHICMWLEDLEGNKSPEGCAYY